MVELDRKSFLKAGGALVAGIAVNKIARPGIIEASIKIQSATGHPVGNAATRQKVESACQNNPDTKSCMRNYEFSQSDKIRGIVNAPITEEVLFRGIPSCNVSISEHSENPFKDVFIGTGRLGMTRRELIVGAISTVVFGAAHNKTDKGFDTETIPAHQTISGGVYWIMQRKLGIISNTVAHAANNYEALT